MCVSCPRNTDITRQNRKRFSHVLGPEPQEVRGCRDQRLPVAGCSSSERPQLQQKANNSGWPDTLGTPIDVIRERPMRSRQGTSTLSCGLVCLHVCQNFSCMGVLPQTHRSIREKAISKKRNRWCPKNGDVVAKLVFRAFGSQPYRPWPLLRVRVRLCTCVCV